MNRYNKNETAVRHSSYFNDLRKRNNAILLGDSLGDANMHHGMPTHSNSSVLKIGFLNDKVITTFLLTVTKSFKSCSDCQIAERTKSFMNSFDIVSD